MDLSSAIARFGRAVRVAAAPVVAAVALCSATPAHAHDAEPNDGREQATGPLSAATDYVGAVSETDEDWYFLYVPSATTVHITAAGEPDEAGSCRPNEGLVIKLRGVAELEPHLVAPDCGQTEAAQLAIPRRGKYFVTVAGTGPRYRFRIEPPSAVSAAVVPRRASGLSITGARLSRSTRELHVDGSISPLAMGTLIGRFTSTAASATFRHPLEAPFGRVRVRQRLTDAQLRAGFGTLQLRYDGNDPTRGETVRVAVESRASRLTIGARALARGDSGLGRLHARGTISQSAYPGEIRLLLRWTETDGTEKSHPLVAAIERDGSWAYDRPLNLDPVEFVNLLEMSASYRGSRGARLQGAVSIADVPTAPAPDAPPADAVLGQRRLTSAARMSFSGVGPVRIGMTIREARQAARTAISMGGEVNPGCASDRFLPAHLGLSTLTISGRIASLSVSRRGVATQSGIRVGDSFARLRRTYGDALRKRGARVDPSTAVYELILGQREMHFVGAGDRIEFMATGRRPEIDASEGCL